jgi:LasA protease
LVVIKHANGSETGYYHLTGINISNNTNVTRGQFLGNTSTNVGCGGTATGSHVHFTLRYKGEFQNWNGRIIGGWTVQEGSEPYYGCMVKNASTLCTTPGVTEARLINDGTIGSGGGLAGDVNGDCIVNIFDYNVVIREFGQRGTNLQGDINKDGVVNVFDYSIVVSNFNNTCTN